MIDENEEKIPKEDIPDELVSFYLLLEEIENGGEDVEND